MKASYLRICRKLAELSDHHQHKMSALIVKNGKIVGKGWNSKKTHTKSPHAYRSCHAEFAAMYYLSDEWLNGATIYVFRENKLGQFANSKPCESCYRLIQEKKIKKICYTHEDGIKVEAV